jgi:hypothetical protein
VRIQTVRQEKGGDGQMVVLSREDDPFDEGYHPPIFGIYGVDADGLLEHITDMPSHAAATQLLNKLLPGIDFAEGR